MTETALTPRKIKSAAPGWTVWLGVMPFFLFAILFLLLPSARLFVGSFTDEAGVAAPETQSRVSQSHQK